MELKRIIAVSASQKLNHQTYGGNAYESSDYWASESEEVPADLEEKEVETVRGRLRGRVEREIERQVKKKIKELQKSAETKFNQVTGKPF